MSGHRDIVLSPSHFNGQRHSHQQEKERTPPSFSPLNSLTMSFTRSLSLSVPLSPLFLSIKVILSVTLPPSLSLWCAGVSHLLQLKRSLTRWKRKKRNVPDSQHKIAHSLRSPIIIFLFFFPPLSSWSSLIISLSTELSKNCKHKCLGTVIMWGTARKSATASGCLPIHTAHHYQSEFTWRQRGFHF